MVLRHPAVVKLLTRLSPLAALCVACTDRWVLQAGSSAPVLEAIAAMESATSSEPELWVVFRTADCLGCAVIDYDVRRVQSLFGERVDVHAIHVGDTRDTAFAMEFFRQRRVDVRLTTIDPHKYRELFGSSPLPALYVVSGQSIVLSQLEDDAKGEPIGLIGTIDSLLRQHDEQSSDRADPG